MQRIAALIIVFAVIGTGVAVGQTASGSVYNLKVLSDGSPDVTDLDSFIDSTTSSQSTDADKVWALFYWTHILKRQSPPMVLHGFEVTDPIRNFADYGYTMCSTISGINQSLYEVLGLRHEYWDVCNHTVSTVEYDGKFHMVDSSMSNLVTTDDKVTLASLQEASADSARLVRERSAYSTSPDGFLTGTDANRNLEDFVNPNTGAVIPGFARNFCATGLKFRDYFYNWDRGHRQVLNIREDESYTRYYRRLGSTSDYWVGSEKVSAPDPAVTFEIDPQNRFGLRGNGKWAFSPDLSAAGWSRAVYRSSNIAAITGGLKPAVSGRTATLVYKVNASNAITSQSIRAQLVRTDINATATLSISLNHGRTWMRVADVGSATGSAVVLSPTLRNEVNGAYETLIRIEMLAPASAPDSVALSELSIQTLTQVNAKALPRLNVGRNEIFVGVGDQSDTMVLWPDLRGDRWKADAHDFSNIASQPVSLPRRYTAVAYPAVLSQDAYLTYRMDAPTDITRFVYGGRLHNFAAGSYIDFLHSLDGGVSWTRSYRLTDTSKPYDVIHYETVSNVPAGVKSVLFKFLIHNTNSNAFRASGLYSVRMEVNHQRNQTMAPIDVTWRWKEVRSDRTTVERTHRQRVSQYPLTYVINVGGSDHPVMESLRLNLADASDPTPYGYSDGIDAGGRKYIHRKQTVGTNLAAQKAYTVSRPPSGFQGSQIASSTVLTDGVVGAPASGGQSYLWGQCWTAGDTVDLQVDLGAARTVSAFRAHLFGYPFWDALKGQVQDRVEIQTSTDGVTFVGRGLLQTSLWKRDVPINYMLPDDEKATAWNFELTTAPVSARYVRYHVTPRRQLCVSELQVLDRIVYAPFDIGVVLPAGAPQPPTVRITQPLPGSVVTPGVPVGIAAEASDSDGSIARVDFLVGGTVVASDVTFPWSATWTPAAPGAYTLTARAADADGFTTISAPVSVTATDASSPGEDVVLWAADARITADWTPVADASAAGGKRLQNPNAGVAKQGTALSSPTKYFELTFNALSGRGYRLWIRGKAISNNFANDSVHVQFDNSLNAAGLVDYRIGTTNGVVYNLEECSGCGLSAWGWEDNGWGTVGALGPLIYFQSSGRQRIRVQVREDGLGIDQIVLSSTKWVKVPPGASKNDQTILPKTDEQGSGTGPTVRLTSPADGASFVAPATVAIAADAADADGSVTRVDFYANDTLIGSDESLPWATTWNASSVGEYSLTARAHDNAGIVTQSAPLRVMLQSGSAGEDVVLYAAEAPVSVNWSPVADATAAGGRRLQNADAGQAKLTTASALPSQYFELTFNAIAGRPYHLWIRGKATSNNWANDSVYVQFDGSVDQAGLPTYRIGTSSAAAYTLEDCVGCGVSGWGWQDNGFGAGVLGAPIFFARTGAQTIRVQVREDGLGIDQIVLSSVKWVNVAPGTLKNDVTILPKQ